MNELLQMVRTMRATVEAKAFSDALKNTRTLLRKSAIPFLEEVHVQFSGGTCILTGTDLDSWIISELPAQGDDFAFVFSRTKDIERACRYFDGPLTLEMTEAQEGVISLSCGSRTGEFGVYSAETYPATPNPKGEVSFRTNVATLLERIGKVSYATKKPGQSSKEITSCVEFSGNQVFAVDGQRAAWDLDTAQTFPQPFLVHAEPLHLLKLFGDMQADFYISTPYLYVMGERMKAIFHLVEDKPYDLHSAIPQTYVEEFLASPKQVLQELRYLNDVVPRARKLYVYLRGNELFMTVNGRKYSTALDTGRQDGQVIMFDLSHLTEAFKQFDKEPQVKVKISGAITPVVIEAEGRSDYALVLPAPMKKDVAA